MIVLISCGVAGALLIPNTLRWRSGNPYLESVQRVADYEEGSGRGRLVQYKRSLLMAVQHPLFGVGPGNWPVHYPSSAARHDPSLNDSTQGMTFNPWPSSDWIAWISERGFAAFGLLALAFLFIAGGAMRQLALAPDPDEGLRAAALLGMIAAVAIAGSFDAVLLLAVPTLLVWSALGALWTPEPSPGRSIWRIALISVVVLVSAGAVHSALQLAAMDIYATHTDRRSLASAARLDPGNYRVHLRLSQVGRREERCEHARAAHALFPSATVAAELSRGCGQPKSRR